MMQRPVRSAHSRTPQRGSADGSQSLPSGQPPNAQFDREEVGKASVERATRPIQRSSRRTASSLVAYAISDLAHSRADHAGIAAPPKRSLGAAILDTAKPCPSDVGWAAMEAPTAAPRHHGPSHLLAPGRLRRRARRQADRADAAGRAAGALPRLRRDCPRRLRPLHPPRHGDLAGLGRRRRDRLPVPRLALRHRRRVHAHPAARRPDPDPEEGADRRVPVRRERTA